MSELSGLFLSAPGVLRNTNTSVHIQSRRANVEPLLFGLEDLERKELALQAIGKRTTLFRYSRVLPPGELKKPSIP